MKVTQLTMFPFILYCHFVRYKELTSSINWFLINCLSFRKDYSWWLYCYSLESVRTRMSSVKYTRIPLSDNSKEELMSAFDYSSPFSYDDSEQAKWNKYKSPFTYGGTTTIHIENESKEVSTSGNVYLIKIHIIISFTKQ